MGLHRFLPDQIRIWSSTRSTRINPFGSSRTSGEVTQKRLENLIWSRSVTIIQ